MSNGEEQHGLPLVEACWPVIEFVTNFVRQVKHGATPDPQQVRYEGISALRDSEDLARNDAESERLWYDRVKAIMVYLVDYKMINAEWEGKMFWLDNPFETDPTILDHAQALGGEDFFTTCDELQKEYELAERRERADRHQLAEQLSIYFIALRLGFKGQYHDRPQELADYTRRLFTRLPAYATTRAKEMFPDAYTRNQEIRVDYHLGRNLTTVLVVLFSVVAAWFFVSQYAWRRCVGSLERSAVVIDHQGQPVASSSSVENDSVSGP